MNFTRNILVFMIVLCAAIMVGLLMNGCSNDITTPPITEPWEPVIVEIPGGGFVDFALVEDDSGIFHIIGIDAKNGNWTTNVDGDSLGFVHMTSPDMKNWTQSILSTTSGPRVFSRSMVCGTCSIRV
jgi:hypothetical protein